MGAHRNGNGQEVRLIVSLYRKRKNGFLLSLDNPFAPDPVRQPAPRKNIIAEALRFSAYLNENPLRSYADAGHHFGVTRTRVSQLMGIVTRLPEEFLHSMKDCKDPDVLKIFPGTELIRISKLPTPEARKKAIDALRKKLPSAGILSQ